MSSSRPRSSAPEPPIVPALGDVACTVLPLASPRGATALSLTSRTVYTLLKPASRHAARALRLAQQLVKLPFCFDFRLSALPVEALEEMLSILKRVQPLRRRECVAAGAGWAPTESDTWRFKSRAELEALVEAGRLATRAVKRARASTLLCGTTLRLDSAQVTDGSVSTTPVAVEWVDGPAADPLQLGLRLVLGPGSSVRLDFELVSGAWSDWAETWAVRDGTLQACISVAAPLPGGGHVVLKQVNDNCTVEDCTGSGGSDGPAALAHALVGATDGIYAVLCITDLNCTKESPSWCPTEVARIMSTSHLGVAC